MGRHLTLDFNIDVGQKVDVSAKQHTSFVGGAPMSEDMTYEATLEKVDGPFGPVEIQDTSQRKFSIVHNPW